MAAQFEEIIPGANPFHVEQGLPQLAKLSFQRGLRRKVAVSAAAGDGTAPLNPTMNQNRVVRLDGEFTAAVEFAGGSGRGRRGCAGLRRGQTLRRGLGFGPERQGSGV